MLAPITVNADSGNTIVAGHQRLGIVDALEGTDDYLIDVAVVHLNAKQEREANIAMNNQSLGGEWDVEKLGELFQGGIDASSVGFEQIDLEALGIGAMTIDAQTPAMQADVAVMEIMKSAGMQPHEPTEYEKKHIGADAAIERRKELRAEAKENPDADPETYVVIVADTREQCDVIAKALGGKPGDKFIPAERMFASLGIE